MSIKSKLRNTLLSLNPYSDAVAVTVGLFSAIDAVNKNADKLTGTTRPEVITQLKKPIKTIIAILNEEVPLDTDLTLSYAIDYAVIFYNLRKSPFVLAPSEIGIIELAVPSYGLDVKNLNAKVVEHKDTIKNLYGLLNEYFKD